MTQRQYQCNYVSKRFDTLHTTHKQFILHTTQKHPQLKRAYFENKRKPTLITNVSIYHANSRVRVFFVLRIPHALIQLIAHAVVVLISHTLIALGSFTRQHEVATACKLLVAALASNQEVEFDKRAFLEPQLNSFQSLNDRIVVGCRFSTRHCVKAFLHTPSVFTVCQLVRFS